MPIMDKMIFSRNTYAPVFPEWKPSTLMSGNFPDAFGQMMLPEVKQDDEREVRRRK